MLSHSVTSNSLPTRLLCPWDFQAGTLERMSFPTLGVLSNPGIKPMSLVFPANFVTYLLSLSTLKCPQHLGISQLEGKFLVNCPNSFRQWNWWWQTSCYTQTCYCRLCCFINYLWFLLLVSLKLSEKWKVIGKQFENRSLLGFCIFSF